MAVQFERSNIPKGILRSQNDIGSPKVRTSRPLIALRCAVADRPYGPEPRIATSQEVIELFGVEQAVSPASLLGRRHGQWNHPVIDRVASRDKSQDLLYHFYLSLRR